MVLGIVADIYICTNLDIALGSLQLADKHTGKGCLTLAITANKGYLLSSLDGKLCTRKDSLLAKGLAYALNIGDNLSRTRCWRKLDVQARHILLINLDTLKALKLLNARLHLIALRGLVAELLDKLLGLLD